MDHKPSTVWCELLDKFNKELKAVLIIYTDAHLDRNRYRGCLADALDHLESDLGLLHQCGTNFSRGSDTCAGTLTVEIDCVVAMLIDKLRGNSSIVWIVTSNLADNRMLQRVKVQMPIWVRTMHQGLVHYHFRPQDSRSSRKGA